MATNAGVEQGHWREVLDHLDLLSQRMNDLGVTQQQVKQQLQETSLKVDKCTADQDMIAQQVWVNGHAVAQITLRQFANENHSDVTDSVVVDEEDTFENVFAANERANPRQNTTFHPRHNRLPPRRDALPHHALPKMLFPSFDGSQPKIWLDKCKNYFRIYQIPDTLWVEAASMHLQDNASKWWQTYKMTYPDVSWQRFSADIQIQFGSDDYRASLNDLLDLKQDTTVEEYTTKFQSLQYDVTMHGGNYDPMFFATHYVRGLREDIRAMVEPQVPTTVEKAVIIAKI